MGEARLRAAPAAALSRRAFVRGGGALVVSLGLSPLVPRARADPAVSPFTSSGPPSATQVDSFVAIHADNTASIMTGRVELGQGTSTGLLVLAAEELGMQVGQLRFVRHDTDVTPYTGGTVGSSSMAVAGPMLRCACASAFQALLGLAATALGEPVATLSVEAGIVSGQSGSVSYADLIGERLFGVTMPAPALAPGAPPSKPVGAYTLVGIAHVPRIDIPAKVMGTYTYVQDIHVPGMLHGRIVRPRGQGAYGDGTTTGIVSVDESSIAGIGDARVVRRNDFLGVVATHEYDAIEAASRLTVTYSDPPEISGSGDLWGSMRAFDTAGAAPPRLPLVVGDFDAAIASSAHVVAESYAYAYQGHMPIGPSCAVAEVTPAGAIVLANSQDAYSLRGTLTGLLGLPLEQIRVEYWEGAGSFGNGAARFDTGQAAAVLSQLAGAPVRLQLMRWDEHGWDNYAPATLVDLRGATDGSGNLVALDYTAFAIPEMSMLTGATTQQAGLPLLPPGAGSAETINSGSQYSLANRRVTAKSLPLWDAYFKTSAMRAPSTPQACFACEQMIDELAYAAGIDPVAFRLQNIQTAQVNDGFGQWQDALAAAAELAGWSPRPAAADVAPTRLRLGRGVALGGFASSQTGVVAEIELDTLTGKIRARTLSVAQVAGLVVDLDGVTNQLEGNLVMGTSRALHEEVPFTRYRSTALDWVSYPILRFAEAPAVRTRIVQRTDLASTGSGEPTQAPVAAAIANAFFDATGVRIREAPFVPGRVRAVLRAAGIVAAAG